MKQGGKMTWWAIGAIVLGALVLTLIVVPPLVHRFMGPSLQSRVENVYAPADVRLQDLQALGFGLESKGATQLRGNGALVLTAKELHFFQFTPASDTRIPLDAITEVKTVKSHLGKTIGRDLLHVSFAADGTPDSMAWAVTDVSAWTGLLRENAH